MGALPATALGECVPPVPPRAPQHSLLLELPRPRRSGAGALAGTGTGTGTGSSSGRSARLCLGPDSDRLPWDDSDEVDSVHEVYREGIFESERLDFLLEKKGEGCRVPSYLGRVPGPVQLWGGGGVPCHGHSVETRRPQVLCVTPFSVHIFFPLRKSQT